MKTLKRWCAVMSLWIAWGMVAIAQPPTRQDEFVPITELPPQDQMPAAPLLIGAYVFALVVLFAYVFFVSRRLNGVQQELERLDSALKQSGRA
jgi:CcmD family protein